jgi:glycosyltransferase involved in cell wall biosynthesis
MMGKPSLCIVHVMSSLAGGGLEHFVLRLAEAQRRRGHDASVVSIKDGPLLDVARAKRVPVTVLRGARKERRVLHAAAHFAWERPDIVHAHNPTALQYGTIGKLAGGGRLVVTDHAQTKGIVRVGTAFEWRLADAVASVSADTARHASDIGYMGVPEVVYNGIDFTPAGRARAEVRAELGIDEGRVVGVNAASFYPVKAQDVLVRAAAEIAARGAPVTVLLVGDGAERGNVEALAKSLGLGPDRVRFLGFRNDVADLLGAADFFVLPSRGEGFPISVLEAMSHRLPVVVTPVGGNPELVGDGVHGFVVPVDDAPALAAAVEKIAADEALRRRLGEAGRARVAGEFSFDRTTDQYEAIYRRVLARGRFW